MEIQKSYCSSLCTGLQDAISYSKKASGRFQNQVQSSVRNFLNDHPLPKTPAFVKSLQRRLESISSTAGELKNQAAKHSAAGKKMLFILGLVAAGGYLYSRTGGSISNSSLVSLQQPSGELFANQTSVNNNQFIQPQSLNPSQSLNPLCNIVILDKSYSEETGLLPTVVSKIKDAYRCAATTSEETGLLPTVVSKIKDAYRCAATTISNAPLGVSVGGGVGFAFGVLASISHPLVSRSEEVTEYSLINGYSYCCQKTVTVFEPGPFKWDNDISFLPLAMLIGGLAGGAIQFFTPPVPDTLRCFSKIFQVDACDAKDWGQLALGYLPILFLSRGCYTRYKSPDVIPFLGPTFRKGNKVIS